MKKIIGKVLKYFIFNMNLFQINFFVLMPSKRLQKPLINMGHL